MLAAGASVRMRTPKQMLSIGGKPALARVVEALLESPVWPVVVVLGANAEQIQPALASYPVLIVENEAWPEGMASSIRAGITTLQQFSRLLDGALVSLCDQPAFSAATVDRLLRAQAETRRSMIASHYAGRQGPPALFLKQHFSALAALTGEEGARALLQGGGADVGVVDAPELAFDLDTPADYETFLRSQPPPA